MESQTRHAGYGTAPGERSLGELFRELTQESSALARQEFALARTEVTRAVSRAAAEAGTLAVGGVVAGLGGVVILAGLIALLGDAMDSYWLAALIVAAVLLVAGGLGARAALAHMRRVRLAPEQTLESLHETQVWAQEQARYVKASLTGEVGDGGNGGHGRAPVLTNRISGQWHDEGTTTVTRVRASETRRERTQREAREHAQAQPGAMGLAKATIREIGDDDITGQAAKLAYYAFMAMPPALMALFGVAGLFGGQALAQELITRAEMALPADAASLVTKFIEQVVTQKAPTALGVGLLLALWGASSVFTGLMDTLNVAYDVEEDRSFIKKRAIALGVMTAGTLLFLVAAAAILGGPAIIEALGLGSFGATLWNILQWPLAFAFMVGAFWIGYYILPNKDQSGCKRTLLKAAAIAALLWLAATAIFRIYIANFSSYSESYGFLGAFIILLLWLYVTGLVVLAGGELASEMEARS